MAIEDFTLAEVIERPSFAELSPSRQRAVKIKWIQKKNVQARKKFGPLFQPQFLTNRLKERGLIDDLIPDEVPIPGDQVSQFAERVVSGTGAKRAVQAVGAIQELGGEVLQGMERKIIEEGIKIRNRFPEAFDFDAFNPDLLSSDAEKRRIAFDNEVEKRLGKTLGTKIKNDAQAIIQGVQKNLEESGAIERLQKDAEEGFLSPNNIANMINQSLPLMLTSLAATVVAGPEIGITLTAPILAGFTAEALKEDDTKEPFEKFVRSYVSGLPQAMVENFIPSRLIKTKNFKGASEFVQVAFLEGLTESVQRAIELVATEANTAKDIVDILRDPENLQSMATEFLAGATLGGIFSGVQQATLFLTNKVKTEKEGKDVSQNTAEEQATAVPEILAAENVAVDTEAPFPQIQEINTEVFDADNNQGQETTAQDSIARPREETVQRRRQLQGAPEEQAGQRALQRVDRVEEITGTGIQKHTGNTPTVKIRQDAVNARSFERIFGIPKQEKFQKESRNLPVKRGIILPKETFPQKVVRKTIDDQKRLQVLLQEVERQGGKVREESNIFQRKRLQPKRVSARVDIVGKKFLRPLAERVAKSSLTQEEIDAYAHAKHASERNKAMGADGLSGMTDAEAGRILATFEKEGKTGELEQFREIIQRLVNEGYLDYLVAGGVLSEKEGNFLKNNYEFYVPLGREMQEFASSGGVKGRGVVGSGIFRAKGSTKTVLPITAQVFHKINSAIARVEENLVGQTLANLVRENPSPFLWKIESAKPIGTKFGPDGELIFPTPASNQFGFRENGVQKFVTINDPLALRALKNEGLTKSIPLMRDFIRLQSSLITQFVPSFAYRNFQRDVGEALVNLQEIKDLRLSKEQKQGLTKDTVKNLPSILKDMYKHVRGDEATRWSPVIKRFILAGGKSGGFWLEEVTRLDKKFKQIQKRYANNGFRKLINPVRSGLEVVKSLNEAAENAIRVSVFNSLTSRGITDSEAAFIAGEITIDFNRQGEWGPRAKSLWLFINPRIQGPARVSRALKSRKVQAAAAALFVAGAMRTYLALLLDEEADEAIFEYNKNTKIIFPIPGFDTSVTLYYLPYGYNAFFAAGSNLAYWAEGKKTKGEALRDTITVALDSFSPLGGSHLSFSEAAPTLVKPLVEIERNEGWHGSPIYPEKNKFVPKVPDSERYWKSVGHTSKFISAWLAGMTETERHPKGFIQVSPESIEYAVSQYGGGVAKGINNMFDTGVSLVSDGKLPKSSHIPVLREFLLDIDIDRYHRNTVYEMLDNSKTVQYGDLELKRFEKALSSFEGKQRKKLERAFKKNQKELRDGAE